MTSWRVAAAVTALVVAGGDGGSGTFIASGPRLDVALFNSGSTAWRSFQVVAPPGLTFIGGTTGNEGSVSCTPTGGTIRCGPIAPSVMPSGGHLTFVATMSPPPACNETFELDVSGDGVNYTRVSDLTAAADCAPHALTRPTLRRVGARIRATPPTWSSPPSSVAYRWELCGATGCRTIAGATSRSLAVTRRDRGRAVRVVVTARIGAVHITTISNRLVIA